MKSQIWSEIRKNYVLWFYNLGSAIRIQFMVVAVHQLFGVRLRTENHFVVA